MNKNVLYFEGAGSRTERSRDVGNCRIRTAFTNNDNEEIYLELIQDCKGNSFIDFCHYITEDPKIDDCNQSVLPCERKETCIWTREAITKMINRTCKCNFDDIEVLDYMEGYRVHDGYKEGKHIYNLMNNHTVNRARTEARNEAYKKIDNEFKQLFNSKYSVIDIMDLSENSITIRTHVSKEKLAKAWLTDEDRTRIIEVKY